MTAEEMAAIHAAAMIHQTPWDAAAIRALASGPGAFAVTQPQGFALGRVAADEGELLTLAVHPGAQGQGLGRQLLAGFEARAATRGAARLFLEVAEPNLPARALYSGACYAVAGRRRGYYRLPDGTRADALVMVKTTASPA